MESDGISTTLKKGNVPISADLNAEGSNLLGFNGDIGVLQKTQAGPIERKNRIISKPIIIKSNGSGDLLLINDRRNVKIPIKKCTAVPREILKFISVGDKNGKYHMAKIGDESQERDKSNQQVNTDKGDTRGLDVVRVDQHKFISQIRRRVSLEDISKLLGKTPKDTNNVILVKCPGSSTEVAGRKDSGGVLDLTKQAKKEGEINLNDESLDKRPELKHNLKEMGKIKHFKERSDKAETTKDQDDQDTTTLPTERTETLPRKSAGKPIRQQQLLRRSNLQKEVERLVKVAISRKAVQRPARPKQKTFLTNTSCQTDQSMATTTTSDSSTQTDESEAVVEKHAFRLVLEEEPRYDGGSGEIVGSDVNFGDGPRMPGTVCASSWVGTLDSFVGNVNVAPSQLVSDEMGYLGDNGALKREKMRFYEYLRKCCLADSAGNLPLHLGVIHNDFDEVRRQTLMLNLRKISIDAVNSNHLTPLHLAIVHNCDESIVEFLLKNGAELSCRDSEGNDPFHLAVFNDAISLLRPLLEYAILTSFDLNGFNHEGFTPLLLATIEDKYEMVETFLEYGSNANVRDQKSGRTSLFHAVENNNLRIVKLLLDSGADKKMKNFSGTSTHDAVFELESITPEIKNLIIGKEMFPVNSGGARTDRRKRGAGGTPGPSENNNKRKDCGKRLKTVATLMKIKI